MQIRKPILFSSNTTYLPSYLPLYLLAIHHILACLPLYSKGTPPIRGEGLGRGCGQDAYHWTVLLHRELWWKFVELAYSTELEM